MLFQWVLYTIHKTYKYFILKETLKLSPIILFTQLKIILLQYLSGKDFDIL